MSTPGLSPWFPASVKPARKGVYERTFGGGDSDVCYSQWDGTQWRFSQDSISAAEATRQRSSYQRLKWRGLASEPAA